ncbi:MAG: glutamate-5-semialdehyde dehydrogenase [Culicoidibacterales bacterium]
MEYIQTLAMQSKRAYDQLKVKTTEEKNNALLAIAKTLEQNVQLILTENEKDMEKAVASEMSDALQDRLRLTETRILGMADAVRDIVKLTDPIGQIVRGSQLPNGLRVEQVREPLGVIAMIFESRPNVTIDAATLALKSGNTCILRGGKEAIHSNKVLVELMRQAIEKYVDVNCVQLVEQLDHQYVHDILHATGYIDLVIPRGSSRLIQTVVKEARVPVIETGAGICHTYVAKTADFEKAISIIVNAKASRPSVCNSLENVLVDVEIAEQFLPLLKHALDDANVELRGDVITCKIIGGTLATDEDYDTEYLDYILSCKVVNGVDEAIEFIHLHSTKHSEAIITENYSEANLFLNRVDSACVYVNASIRFSDGSEFGYGAEIGISTQKMHARGPVGLQELTTTKYKIYGSGQVRE